MITDQALDAVDRFLSVADGEPLGELALTLSLLDATDLRQRQAVREAIQRHSWTDIGAALGVSKQAAHRKFVHLIAEDVRHQKRALRQAQRSGEPAEAGAALTAVLEGVTVLKKAGRRPASD